MFWLKPTCKRFSNPKIAEKRKKMGEKQCVQKCKISLQRETLERQGEAVCSGRLTPGAQMPDGETAESNPGK